MNKHLLLCLFASLIMSPFSFAIAESTYTYTTTQNNATITYDNLNRIIEKQTSTDTIKYNYDQQYQNTLSNITSNEVSIKYEYDKRQRPIKEIVTLDGVSFEKSNIYDSMDRIVSVQEPGTDIDFLYNKQGKIRKIPGFIDSSDYNEFGSIVNRTYANDLVSSYSYDSDNNRLISIKIPNVQNLTYTYDSVGNILTINDRINGKTHSMRYDSLDRMTEAVIGNDVYRYGYNSIGNIMKIAKNNESKKLVYTGSPIHAPSSVKQGSSGVDVYNPMPLDTESKNRTYGFFLVNDRNSSTTNVNWSVDFGSEEASSAIPITLNSNVMVLAQTAYEDVGYHNFTVTAESPGITDTETNAVFFGARAKSLDRIYSNGSRSMFEFISENDIDESIDNVSWNCSDGIISIYSTTLQGKQGMYDYLMHNYTTPGEKTFSCTIKTPTSQETKSIVFTVKGVEIEKYDVLLKNTSRNVVSFEARNYFNPVTTDISFNAEQDGFTKEVSLGTDEAVMVFSEVNYSSDGRKAIDISASSDVSNTSYTNTFTEQGVSIENYQRSGENSTRQILAFDVENNWNYGTVDINISEPNIHETVNLDTNKKILVVIEHNYTQGNKQAVVTAQTSSFIDKITDFFVIRPLELKSFQTLLESGTKAVSEMIVRNNAEENQQFSWKLDTEIENVTSDISIPITDEAFVFVENEYSDEGVYRTTAVINSTSYNDTAAGVVII